MTCRLEHQWKEKSLILKSLWAKLSRKDKVSIKYVLIRLKIFSIKQIWILLESYNKINILILVVAVMSAMKMEMAVQVSYFIENEQIVSN